ncbi:predicted protein [Plenodomus lingam JN3]|uniref:Predicted protein n=1 Tax=Leptosphaeria maculans (strain JN3 / isolate v23.1.3 / race Av1-4-5-6-7-8) TaxID=985895 RepID=E4ZZP5_LEPMJ|nr:predicted protein [Plenodomus lingam JN3]CBX97161.1 predicted protein [Plenodomus lingam JN3]
MIYVVADDDSVHFSQMFKILEALNLSDLVKRLQHVQFSEISWVTEMLGKGNKPQLILDKTLKR